MGTGEVEIGPDEGRTPEGRKDTTLSRRLAGDRLRDDGAKPERLGAVFGQTPGDRPDEVAIAIAAKHLEASKAPLAEAGPVVLDGASLGLVDDRLLISPAI
jgi:hypothetical protein